MAVEDNSDAHRDVVIIGGSFSGAALAILLKRWRPATRILLVERHATFNARVGEATVELSAYFLHRVLGLWDHLSREHLPKHGLRYWFTDGPTRTLAEMSEVGPSEMPRLASFQLDRARLDDHLVALARTLGVEVRRPARVADVRLAWPRSEIVVDAEGHGETLTARWIVDASGRQALLARKLAIHERVDAHGTAALWARWRGVEDLDGPAITAHQAGSGFLPPLTGSRRLATNHFCGYGFWSWVIPLADGRTSIGLVHDKKLAPAGDGTPKERYLAFVTTHPGLRELVANATMEDDDFRSYDHLAYRARRYAAPGWALIGDAASFIDPYYSPGLDHCAISAYATAELVRDELDGHLGASELEARVALHDARFQRSYDRWLSALYLDKYEILGDAELVAASYLIDTATYYLGVVGPVYRDVAHLRNPILGLDNVGASVAYRVLRFLNQRLVAAARQRRRAGTYGRRNVGWRRYRRSFGLERDAVGVLAEGLRRWLAVEAHSLSLRLRPAWAATEPEPVPPAAAPHDASRLV